MKIDSDKIVNRGLETCLIADLKFFLNIMSNDNITKN